MAHVFVAPHPDDVALSCGGLIASLRELGQNVTILTVFSGGPAEAEGDGTFGLDGAGGSGGGLGGSDGGLTSYQREALGFGTKAIWPAEVAFNRANLRNDWNVTPPGGAPPPWQATPDRLEATQAEADASAKRFWQRASWYRRASIHNTPLGGQPLVDEQPQQGAVLTTELVEAGAEGDAMAIRRLEDERFAYFSEASVVFLDLPDAVFRGYGGDDQLLGAVRDDDRAPIDIIRREIVRLEPQTVYLPLAVGNHVDHQLMREVGLSLLGEARRWVMPGPDWAGRVTFYEDFPYAWWDGFDRLEQLPEGSLASLPPDVSLVPEYDDISDVLERKINGIRLYESQLDRQFGGERAMDGAVRAYGSKVGRLGGLDGAAERYWASARL